MHICTFASSPFSASIQQCLISTSVTKDYQAIARTQTVTSLILCPKFDDTPPWCRPHVNGSRRPQDARLIKMTGTSCRKCYQLT